MGAKDQGNTSVLPTGHPDPSVVLQLGSDNQTPVNDGINVYPESHC